MESESGEDRRTRRYRCTDDLGSGGAAPAPVADAVTVAIAPHRGSHASYGWLGGIVALVTISLAAALGGSTPLQKIAPPSPVPPSVAPPTGPPVLGVPRALPAGYHLAFVDQFGGTALDARKWSPCYPWADPKGCTNPSNRELEWYVPGQVQVSGGILHLAAAYRTVTGTDASGRPKRYPWVSGLVTTAAHFQFTYGYVEFQAKVPAGRALWPALWMLPVAEASTPEVDILEVLGQEPSRADLTFHWGAPGHDNQEGLAIRGTDWSAGWHTYSVLWQPGHMTWFIDGIREWKVDHDIPNAPMYLIANLAVGGLWPGGTDATTPDHASFDIASVRVWQP